MYLMFFIVLLVFSGLFFASDSPILALITAIFPLGYASPMITSITLKGKPIDLISVLSMSLISLVFVLMAYIVYRFKKVEV